MQTALTGLELLPGISCIEIARVEAQNHSRVEQKKRKPLNLNHRPEGSCQNRRHTKAAGPVDLQFHALSKGPLADKQHQQLSKEHQTHRPAWKKFELPRNEHACQGESSISDGVHQRPKPAVLTGKAGDETVEIVAPADHPIDHRRRNAVLVASR